MCNPNPIHRMPLFSLFGKGIVAPAIGIARGALEATIEGLQMRRMQSGSMVADEPTAQLRIGEAAAEIDAAWTLLGRDCLEVHHRAESGEVPSTEERHRWRRNDSYAGNMCVRAVDRLMALQGGLRYLEHGELGLVRKTLVERRRLARLGPHRVRPLRFLMPVYRGDRVGRFRLRIGMLFYDRLAGGGQPVPHHRYLRPPALQRELALATDGLLGGFAFGDCATDDARLVTEIVDGAYRAGAAAVNRAEAVELLVDDKRACGAVVEDRETGRRVEVRALATVASAGPWVSSLAATVSGAQPVATRLTKGVHLVLPALPAVEHDRPGSERALVISSNDDKRIVFLIPWYGRTLLGTTDTDYAGSTGAVRVEPQDAAYLLERCRRVVRGVEWSEADVIAGFAGLRTLPATSDSDPSAVTREWSLARPLTGLLVPVGGKLTSARADAALIVDRVVREAGWPARPSPTLELPFPWSPAEAFEPWFEKTTRRAVDAGLDRETAGNCALRYGRRIAEVLDAIRHDASLAQRVVADLAFCRAEIVHAEEHEMARSLTDVLRRRLPLLLLSRLDRATIEDAARLAGQRLGWDEARRQREADAVAGTGHEAGVR